jgi:uncharacterized RDD family membrane protein YckC
MSSITPAAPGALGLLTPDAAPGPEPAGLGVRAGARVIDMVVLNIVGFVTLFGVGVFLAVFAAVAGIPVEPLLARMQRVTVVGILGALLAAVAFHTLTEGLHGSSPGKLILGLTVLDEAGSPCRLGAALIRSLGFFVDALFFGVPAIVSMQGSEIQQRLGDKWAHTVVVRRRSVPPDQQRSLLRFLGASLAACIAYSSIFGLSQFLKL